MRPLEALREAGGDTRLMTVSRWVLGGVFLAGGIALLVMGKKAKVLVTQPETTTAANESLANLPTP